MLVITRLASQNLNQMKFFSAIFLMIPFLVAQLESGINSDEVINSSMDIISIANVENVSKQDDKKIIIKLSAEWCKPCQKLSKTLQDEELQHYLESNFHIVDFDIQTKETIVYQGKVYNYVDNPKMGYHELAYQLLEERLSFPALLVLDGELNKIDLARGYKNKRQLLEYLQKV